MSSLLMEKTLIPVVKHPARRPPPTCSSCSSLLSTLNPVQDWFPTGDPAVLRHSFEQATWAAIWWKLAAATCVVTLFVWDYVLAASPARYEHVALRFTTWALFVACEYMLLSLLNSVLASYQTAAAPFRLAHIKLTWACFVLSAHAAMLCSVGYWISLVWNPQGKIAHLDLTTVAAHAGVLLLLLLDGFCVNAIPFRWMHWCWMVVPYNVAFLLWSILIDWKEIPVPVAWEMDSTTDDAIFPSADEWQDNSRFYLTWCLVMLFGLSPTVFWVLRQISRFARTLRGLPAGCSNFGEIGNHTHDDGDKQDDESMEIVLEKVDRAAGHRQIRDDEHSSTATHRTEQLFRGVELADDSSVGTLHSVDVWQNNNEPGKKRSPVVQRV